MPESFSCPRCGAESHHPDDVENGYCGSCRDYTGGKDSRIAFQEFLRTGRIPGWRERALIDLATRDAAREAAQNVEWWTR